MIYENNVQGIIINKHCLYGTLVGAPKYTGLQSSLLS